MWTGGEFRLSRAMIMMGDNHYDGDNAGVEDLT